MSLQHPQYKVAAVQSAPAFLDLDESIAKTIRLIEEAASNGAQLIAFPECWIPGYPFWIWLGAPAWGLQFVQRYFDNSMTADRVEMEEIQAAARANNIHVVLGFTERSGGSLYIAQAIIDDEGNKLAARRKLRPTHVERSTFGEGDGSDLKVHQTSIGRIGALNCWEHLQPLNKQAMFSQHEEVHVASWPAFCVYRGSAYALGPEVNLAAMQIYSVEGQCFSIGATSIFSANMIDMLCDTEDKRQLIVEGGGAAMIYGPDGRPLSERLPETEEGLVYADIDLGMIALAKAVADPVGHYSRPDVLQLVFDPNPKSRVIKMKHAPAALKTQPDTEPASPAEDTESDITV